jgi:sugar lactone lactonase YvrE
VRKITAATGIITTVAGTGAEVETPSGDGGPATAATFVFPARVAVDASGHLYITDRSARNVRRVDAGTGTITTVAGTGAIGSGGDGGLATAAQFTDPVGIAVDAAGNLYITDVFGQRIRKVTAATGIITTIAGTGVAGFSGDSGLATTATVNEPVDVAVDTSGHVYFSDYSNRRVRMIDTAGVIQTVAGTSTTVTRADPLAVGGDGGAATAALMRSPLGVAVDTQGSLYITDEIDHRVRKAANPAQFTTQPIDRSVTSGAVVTFTAAASGSPTYQWQISINGGVTWTPLTNTAPYSGVTTGTLSIAAATAGLTGARYRAAATNTIATSYSVPALLTVASLSAPAFTTQPTAATITAGLNVTFTGVAAGTPTPALRWQISTDGGTTFSDLSDTSPYSGVTTSTLTITGASAALNGARYRVVATNSEGTATSVAGALSVRGALSASPLALTFQATKAGAAGAITAVTPAQTVTVSFAGAASSWTASVAVPWLEVTRGSGSAAGQFTIGIINPLNAVGGSTLLTDVVTITAPGTPNVSITIPITLRVNLDGTPTAAPLGQVDTPAQGVTGVQGAFAMTGWVVDDVGVQHVRIYRQCLGFDVPAACQTVLGTSVVFVGEAAVIAGARPDVEALYSTLPAANSAGWGFLILSNLLPNISTSNASGGGVGTFTLFAVATDIEGNQRLLGRTVSDTTPTTITAANDTIARPFGAIDTPGQGATVSGTLNNFGWALTPDSNTTADGTDILVPVTGSTITVFIDGASVGTATFNLCRGTVGNPVPAGVLCDDDVSSIFRGAGVYRNLDAARGPIGLRTISTAALTNGLHTIQWGVSDSAGRSEGIGSRYFNVLNSASDACDSAECAVRSAEARTSGPTSDKAPAGRLRDPGTPIFGRTGFSVDRAFVPVEAVDGVPTIVVPEMGRVELQVPGATDVSLLTNGEVRSAPVGLSVDAETGMVRWSVGPGYLGTYRLNVVVRSAECASAECEERVLIDMTVAPMALVEEPVRMHVDSIRTSHSALRTSHFVMEGWALDPHAETGTGIGAVHVWARRKMSSEAISPAYPEIASELIFLGTADLGVTRPDVAAAHGARFPKAGFSFQGALGEGEWEITAFIWNIRTQRFEDARSVVVVIR